MDSFLIFISRQTVISERHEYVIFFSSGVPERPRCVVIYNVALFAKLEAQ